MLGYIDCKTALSISSIRFMASYWFALILKGLKILTVFSFSVCLYATNFVGKIQRSHADKMSISMQSIINLFLSFLEFFYCLNKCHIVILNNSINTSLI